MERSKSVKEDSYSIHNKPHQVGNSLAKPNKTVRQINPSKYSANPGGFYIVNSDGYSANPGGFYIVNSDGYSANPCGFYPINSDNRYPSNSGGCFPNPMGHSPYPNVDAPTFFQPLFIIPNGLDIFLRQQKRRETYHLPAVQSTCRRFLVINQ